MPPTTQYSHGTCGPISFSPATNYYSSRALLSFKLSIPSPTLHPRISSSSTTTFTSSSSTTNPSGTNDRRQRSKLLRSSIHGVTLNPSHIKTYPVDSNHSISGYVASSRSPRITHQLLGTMPQRNAMHYASVIGSHIRSQRWEDVLSVFILMLKDDARPDKFLVPKILKACSELGDFGVGAMVHGYLVRNGLELDVFICNSLINMYANCGDLASARMIFDKMPDRDVVSWTALVNAYANAGLLDEAVVIFERMEENGVRPDLISWNALISGFARNGEINVACSLLDKMREGGMKPGVNSWNGVISGCVQNGFFEDAFEVLREMCLYESLNAVTIASILPACSGLHALNLGRELHSYVIRHGIKVNVFLGGSLIDMYIKGNKRKNAERIFAGLEDKNATVWNEMIASYASQDRMSESLDLIRAMQESGLKPDVITYNTILASYARKGQIDETSKLFSEMGRRGLEPNVVSMNAVISGFHHSGFNMDALELFRTMQLPKKEISTDSKLLINIPDVLVQPNDVTITSVLSICTDLKLHHLGKEIHGYILRKSFESNIFISSALVDMYANCGDMVSATKAFHGISDKGTVTWNILMAGYNYNGEPEAALKLFPQMLGQGCAPSSITFMILLLACNSLNALRLGRGMHGYIIKNNLDVCPAAIASSLIDMYVKCGSISEARLAFDCTIVKDITVWNAMMCGYSLHRMTENAISLFRQMKQSGIGPDHITFTAILSACSREGFVDEGWNFFNTMEDAYGVTHTLEHFTCMVDIMSNASLLEESLDFIRRMPFEPDACVWATLLKACRLHSNYEIGKTAARALFELEPSNASNYILLSNIFAMASMPDSAMDVRTFMRARGLKMVEACSWIHLGTTVHTFKAGDRMHPDVEKILDTWNKLACQMAQAGYFPHDVIFCEEGQVDPFSCYHTEKLAICLGIISLDSHSPIRVSKNVRMCMDCHSSTKFISKIHGREIFVRDGCCYHHFKDGSCSCRDRW